MAVSAYYRQPYYGRRDVNDLSRFESGMEYLKKSDVKLLSKYLNAVSIPQWVIHAKKQKQSLKRWGQVSLDLLRELVC